MYFIESGQIKLLILSAEGKECILAIQAAGDIFGELCLSGLGARLETAVAMERTILKQIPTSKIGEDQLFYCRQRGIGPEDAVNMIVSGFYKQVYRQLPMEFAVEAQKLLT